MSVTGRSWSARKLKISRRRGSATALKASEVVEALAMRLIYSHTGICQGKFNYSAHHTRWPGSPRVEARFRLVFARVDRNFSQFRAIIAGRFTSRQNARVNSVAVCRGHNTGNACAALVGLASLVARPHPAHTLDCVFTVGLFAGDGFGCGGDRNPPVRPIREQFRVARPNADENLPVRMCVVVSGNCFRGRRLWHTRCRAMVSSGLRVWDVRVLATGDEHSVGNYSTSPIHAANGGKITLFVFIRFGAANEARSAFAVVAFTPFSCKFSSKVCITPLMFSATTTVCPL
jgi:hypothetical protein